MLGRTSTTLGQFSFTGTTLRTLSVGGPRLNLFTVFSSVGYYGLPALSVNRRGVDESSPFPFNLGGGTKGTVYIGIVERPRGDSVWGFL